jgi:hypothetical protein
MYEREEKCIGGFGEDTWRSETTGKSWEYVGGML